MTERWYETDSYTTDFDATVLSAEQADGVTKVVLNGTFFFPEEGGQSPDRGTLGGFPVTDVQIKDGVIIHTVACPTRVGETAVDSMQEKTTACAIHVGETIHGTVDWDFRFKNMQMHSAEHIFSGLVFRLYGFANVGFHLSENSATMDYNGVLTEEDVTRLEMLANRAIIENHPIRAWYPSEEELKTLSYRSKKALTGPIRLVEVQDVDLCACCVPHVRSTGEIGCMKILSRENYKGGVRLHYIGGFRAIEHYGAALKLIGDAGQRLSVKSDGIVSAIEKLILDNKELNYRLVEAERATVASKIRDTYSAAPSENFLLFLPGDGAILRYAADTAEQYCTGTCALFAGDDERGYRYLLENPNGSVTELQTLLKTELAARGGGTEHSVSGRVTAAEEDIRKLLSRLGFR
jgi:alanyl-tRNA synthetase